MATKRKFEGSQNDNQSVTGYIQNVTDITTAASSSTRYFHGIIQTGHDNFVRFVSFSPEKQTTIKSAQTTKSPVRISECAIKPKGDTTEIIIRRNSQVTVCKKIDFARSTRTEEPTKFMPLSDIETANTMCSVKAKVLSTSTTTLVQTRYGQRQVQTVIIADETKSMTLALWQQHVHKLQQHHFYSIESLVSTIFQGELQLSTTAKSEFKDIDEFKVTEERVVKATNSTGKVTCCTMKIGSKCISCNKPLNPETNNDIIRCENCHAKQKLKNTQLSKTLTLQIDTEPNTTKKFIVFNDVVSSFLHRYNLYKMNNDEIENSILDMELIIHHNVNSDVVSQLEVKTESSDELENK